MQFFESVMAGPSCSVINAAASPTRPKTATGGGKATIAHPVHPHSSHISPPHPHSTHDRSHGHEHPPPMPAGHTCGPPSGATGSGLGHNQHPTTLAPRKSLVHGTSEIFKCLHQSPSTDLHSKVSHSPLRFHSLLSVSRVNLVRII